MRTYGDLWALVLVLSFAVGANAQTTAALTREQVQVAVDSDEVTNPAAGRAVVYSTQVRVADATWLQLVFDEVTLGGGARGPAADLACRFCIPDSHRRHAHAMAETLGVFQR